MVIRSKNPNQSLKPTSFTSTQTIETTQAPSKSQTPADINEIHQGRTERKFKAIQAESTLSRPGFHFLAQNIASLVDEKSNQFQKAQELKTQMQQSTNEALNQSLLNQWHQLQPKMAQTQKKLQQLRRKKKWMQAGIIEHKQVQIGQKWVDNAQRIAEMSEGAPKSLAALNHQIDMMQQAAGLSEQGMRLPITEAGACRRHELGKWLANALPNQMLTKSILQVFTQSNAAPQRPSPTAQWLAQGNGGANLSRLNQLNQSALMGHDL